MPKLKGRLTDRKIAALPNGKYADGLNLYMCVRGGSRAWVLRYVYSGKRHEIHLGLYPVMGINDARLEALRGKAALADGLDPLVARDARRAARKAAMTSGHLQPGTVDPNR